MTGAAAPGAAAGSTGTTAAGPGVPTAGPAAAATGSAAATAGSAGAPSGTAVTSGSGAAGAGRGPSSTTRRRCCTTSSLGAAEPLTRRSTGLAEFDRALGGGVVPGSAILMGGDFMTFVNVPSLLIVIGGAIAFGFLGLFLGPTLLAVGCELIREWNAVDADDLPLRPTA